ncbi:protein high chlorophyll fluorescent 107 isoform X2 [Momordica charantia]|uniref:Protein high chlorophyll fluorescent 107 isoform X2 n=1 Tax=Momordica charantia TaxID=3673 RepID=A0A6J1C9V3_MOMCH|nr:protein high chlorophyll fluorescent 107 isoform X2 [Momordica charantia]
MQVFSSSPSTTSFNLLSSSKNPSSLSKYRCKIPTITLSVRPCCSSMDSSSTAILVEQHPSVAERSSDGGRESNGSSGSNREASEEVLKVRRPVMEFPGEDSGDQEDEEAEVELRSSIIDAGLTEIAKKMPIFEPENRVDSSALERPLIINLDLALYRAKMLARNFQYEEAQQVLQKCWAVLESRMGNIRKARELFDAATVANKKHIAAWHGWAVLELKQGNIKKARNLLAKGLKNCGGNEYIYQTLARLEAKSNRYEHARYLFKQATKCNPKSCASWLAWAQLEMQQENNLLARELFEKAIQASPKNRFAWHIWGLFEANMGNIEKGRKLLKIGHVLNPRDPVLLQSLGLLEYKNSSASPARVLFRRASELDPKHQPVWIAWGWMEWKEGNMGKARELYQRALLIDSASESAARCLQAWGVLEQRVGNLSAARRLYRSSLNINSQSYVTWMTWAELEEDQGNAIRAEEIRNLYFQQRTEVVDDASWVMGFLDVIDPALDSIKRLLKLEEDPFTMPRAAEGGTRSTSSEDSAASSSGNNVVESETGFDLDAFLMKKLSIDTSKLEIQLETTQPKRFKYQRRQLRPDNRRDMAVSLHQRTASLPG